MSGDVAQLSIRVSSEEAKTAQADLQGLGNTSQWLEGIITKLAAAFGAYKMAEYAKDTIMLAARYDTLGVAMQVVGANAGYTAKQMNAFEIALENTGISMIESRNNLARMAAAHLDLKQAADLGRVAQNAAGIAGINSSEAFERLVQGIVSGQPRILHTMGLFANFSVAEKQWAQEHGRTADSLSNVEKIQIRMNETLREGASRAGVYEAAMGTAGKQIFSMERYIQDLQVLVGEVFQPALTVAVFDLADEFKGMARWVKDNAFALDDLGRALTGDVRVMGEFTKMLRDAAGGANSATESVSFLTSTLQGVGFMIAGITDATRGLVGVLAELANTASYDWQKFQNLFLFGKNPTYSKSQISENLLGGFQSGNTALTTWYDSVFGDQPSHVVGGGTQKITDPSIAAALEKRRRDQEAASGAAAEFAKNQKSMVDSLKEQAITLMGGKTALEDYKASLVGLAGSPILTLVQRLRELAETKKIVDDEMSAIGTYNSGIRGKRLDDSLSIKTQYEQALDPMLKYEERRKEIARLPFLNTEQRLFAEQKAWEELTEAGKKYVAMRAEGKRIEEQNQTPEEKAMLKLTELKKIQDAGGVSLQGYEREWIKLQQQAGTAAGFVADAWETGVNGMSTAFSNFVATGKGSFSSLVSSILADLARLQANKAFASLLSMGLDAIAHYFNPGGTWNGQNTGTQPGWDYFDSPTPNAVPPGGSGYAPPVAYRGGSGAAPVSSQVNITITDGKVTSDSKATGQNAAELGRMIGAKVREVIVTEMRPAGLLNPVGANG